MRIGSTEKFGYICRMKKASAMKQNLPLLWWIVSTLLFALVFGALGYEADQALLLAVLFLPGLVVLRYFVPQLEGEKRPKVIADTLYLLAAVVALEYLALVFGHRIAFDTQPETLPGPIFNPLFIGLLLVAFILPERALERYAERFEQRDTPLRFISDRRHVTLDPAEILYVESNDNEVWIHTSDSGVFRTKTRISQWEAQLDRRFLRVHRSYIVNTERIEVVRPTRIRIGGTEIEISRKYKEEVRRRLGSQPSPESDRA